MKYTSYLQVDKAADRLFADKKYAEGIALLESARNLFPDRLFDILYYEIFMYIAKGDLDRCLDLIEELLKKGFFIYLEWNVFDPLRNSERFKAAFEINQRRQSEFQAQAKMIDQVCLPKGYTPDRRHPLFIALHGNGSAIDSFKELWEPETMLEQDFVVLYVQSSQVMSTNGFSWTDNWKKTREDIKAAYDGIIKSYSIDVDQVIVGGFSGGGMAAIETAMSNIFPVKGFIALSASRKPENFNAEAVKQASRRGVKGVMMHGELEDAPEEMDMVKVFDEAGLAVHFVNNPGIGHTIPDNFPEKLADAIRYVMS